MNTSHFLRSEIVMIDRILYSSVDKAEKDELNESGKELTTIANIYRQQFYSSPWAFARGWHSFLKPCAAPHFWYRRLTNDSVSFIFQPRPGRRPRGRPGNTAQLQTTPRIQSPISQHLEKGESDLARPRDENFKLDMPQCLTQRYDNFAIPVALGISSRNFIAMDISSRPVKQLRI